MQTPNTSFSTVPFSKACTRRLSFRHAPASRLLAISAMVCALAALEITLNALPTAHPLSMTLSPSGKVTACKDHEFTAVPGFSDHTGQWTSTEWIYNAAKAAELGCEVKTNEFTYDSLTGAWKANGCVQRIDGRTLKRGTISISVVIGWSCSKVPETERCTITSATSQTIYVDVIPDDEEADCGSGGAGGSCGSDGSPRWGSGFVGNKDLDFRLNLGAAERDGFGKYDTAGYLALKAATGSVGLASPLALTLPYTRSGVTRIPTNTAQQLQQIKMPQGLVNVTNMVANQSYALDIYDQTQVGAQQGDGTYALTNNAQWTARWAVAWNDANKTLTVSETASGGGPTKTYVYTYSVNGNLNKWRLDRPDQSYSITTTNTVQGGYVRTFELHIANGDLVRTNEQTFKLVSSTGDYLLTKEIEGNGTVNRVTLYDYIPEGELNTNKLRRVDYPDGDWVYYQYDFMGRKEYEYAAYNDSQLDPGAVPDPNRIGCKQIHYEHDETGLSPINTIVSLPFGSSNNYTLYEVSQRFGTNSYAFSLVREYAVPDDPTTALVTLTSYITNSGSAHLGAVKSIQYPDGHAEYFGYSVPDGNGAVTTTNFVGQPNGSGGILNGKQTETRRDRFGRTLSVISRAITNSQAGITLSHHSFQYTDTLNQPHDYSEINNLAQQTNFYYVDCCGLASVTHPDGTITQYNNDDLHRRTASMILRGGASGVKTTNILDAAGQVLSTKRIGAGDPLSAAVAIQQYQYDILGNIIRQTNALGGVTTNLFLRWGTQNARREVTLFPDGGTSTNDYQLDGRLLEVTGTAVNPVKFEYGIAPNAGGYATQYVKEIKLDSSWNPTTEWTKTYRDGLDRESSVVYADSTVGTEADNPFSASMYNSLGQLWLQRDPDGVTNIFKYNGQGELEKSGLDVNWSGLLETNSADRITRTTNSFLAAAGGKPDRVQTDTCVWSENGQGGYVEKLISRTETSTNGLHTWQTLWREAGNDSTKAVTETETVLSPATHQRTVTATSPDGSQTVSVYLYGLLQSVTRKDNTAGHQQVTQTTYGYDKYDRQNTVADARNGTTTFYFNDADQVATTVSPDSGTGPQVTTTFFDNMERVTGVRNPDGNTTTNLYFSNGLLQKTWGSRIYPVEYSYDAQGRMRTNKTWQSFSAGTGTAITRWNYDPYRGWLKSKDYPDATSGVPPASESTSGPVYTYTPGGRLYTRTWLRPGVSGQPIVTTYKYGCTDAPTGNEHGDLISVEYSNDPASTPNLTNSYDRRGRRSQVARAGMTTTLAYNDANQQTSESYSGGTLAGLSVSSSYNNHLQRESLSLGGTGTYSVGFAYDPASRLATVTEGVYVVGYSYLANSHLVSQIFFTNNGSLRMTTTRQHDRLNRLQSIFSVPTGSGAPSLPLSHGYVYNSANQRIRSTLADGSFWIYTYDLLGQVTSGKRYWQDGTPVAGQQFEYGFDDIGNRKSTAVGGDASGGGLRGASYTANRLNQYSSRSVPAFADFLGIANPTASVTVNGNTPYRKGEYFQYALSVPNDSAAQYPLATIISSFPPGETQTGRVFVPQTPENFGHDADGNLTNDGRWAFTWDAENRLVRMESRANPPAYSNRRLEFDYDHQGRRIYSKITNLDTSAVLSEDKFLYDGWNLLAELNATNSAIIRYFVWGLDLSGSEQGAGGVGGLLKLAYNGAATTNCFIAYDGNGNVTGLIKADDASLVARYEYGPFGEVIRATGPMAKANPFRFSTKYQDDESDLLYYGYRYYNANTGRWINRDPAEEEGGENLYAFSLNNPIRYADAYGLEGLEYRSDGHTFFDATWFESVRIHDESGTQASSSAFIDQWGALVLGSEPDPAICNSTIAKPPAHHPNSYVRAEVKNTSKCPLKVNCSCTVSYSIKLWSPAARKEADIFGHVLGVSIEARYKPSNLGGLWLARGSNTKFVGLGFPLGPGQTRELYYAAPNLATRGRDSGFAERVDGACSCSVAQ